MPMIVKKEKFFKKVLTFGKVCCIIIFVAERAIRNADVAHLVERNLAKVEVAGSSPVIRSRAPDFCRALFLCTSVDDALLLIWNVECGIVVHCGKATAEYNASPSAQL